MRGGLQPLLAVSNELSGMNSTATLRVATRNDDATFHDQKKARVARAPTPRVSSGYTVPGGWTVHPDDLTATQTTAHVCSRRPE